MHDEVISKNIARLRGERSQSQIAQAMKAKGYKNWAQSTVSSIEKGERSIKLAEALDLASVLGVSLSAMIQAETPLVKAEQDLDAGYLDLLSAREELTTSFEHTFKAILNLESLLENYARVGGDQKQKTYSDSVDLLANRTFIWGAISNALLGYLSPQKCGDSTVLAAIGNPAPKFENLTLTELLEQVDTE